MISMFAINTAWQATLKNLWKNPHTSHLWWPSSVKRCLLRNFSILFKKPSNKLMSFSYQSERNLNFKPFFQPLLSLKVLAEITYFVWIETWRAQVSQLYEFPKSYFSHSLFKALSVSRISGQFYVQKFWTSRALRTAPKLVLRYRACDI